ncbi:beta strand repeat-containing protein [Maribacter arenosus]|nr:Calx-beta domain-containing protein [Maribacter arenosus]
MFFLLLGMSFYGQDTFLDNFNTVSYSNNNGTMNYSANWVDDEDGDPTNGRIYINGGSNRLRIQNMDGVILSRALNLAGATGVTLSMTYTEISGNERIDVDLWNGTGWNTVATLNGSGTVNYNLAADEMSASSQIRFVTNSGDWGSSEAYEIDNVQFSGTVPPGISIDDITVNEDDGTAVFTATHIGTNTGGSFTVNYQTVDGTATAGTDYMSSTGTLSFNGTAGDTEQITIPIIDNSLYDGDKDFTIQFTSVSDASVNIGDVGIGTIVDNEVILSDVPLTLIEEFNGYYDYAVTGGSLRDQPNTGNPCSIVPTSTVTGLTTAIPGTATIEKAYLLWAHSNQNPDTSIIFEGQTVNANIAYTSSLSGNRIFYGMLSDVTSIIQGIPNPSTNVYDFSGLNIDNTDTFAQYCSTATTLGGWSLLIFYEETSLPAVSINLYHGFKGESNTSNSYTLSGFFAIGATGAKTTALSWEGDSTLDGNSAGTTNPNGESLIVTNQLGTNFTMTGDGGQTGNNAYNSTIYDNTILPNINITNSYGVDLDTYDISPYIAPTDSQITVNVNTGQDFVISNLVLVKVPSNLIVGKIFEDINYGGGTGRNRVAASGIPIQGVTMELYNSLGVFVESTVTDASGNYSFGGMANGSYSIRAVNGTVASTRGGGTACGSCLPVQTFRRNYTTGIGFADITNEVGGANPSGVDSGEGTLTNAQSVSTVTITSEGVVGLDFGFNFNTIVNTNEDGQGSLEQFILNSNELDEIGLDIVANSIFDPAAGEDTSIFMIPSTGDPLGRTADSNYTSGIFDIVISNGSPLTDVGGMNTIIDGRTQTAYSGDTNTGTIGSGGAPVGVSTINLPNYELPEIQLNRSGGDVINTVGDLVVIRNIAVHGNNNAGIRVVGGSTTITNTLIGVNAAGVNSGNKDYGVEILGGIAIIDGTYIATNTDAGILINGGTSTTIQNNHITGNGDDACDDNITIQSGTGIIIQHNLIENAASLAIDGDGISGGVVISENTVTSSGQDGGNCGGNVENAGIRLDGNNSSITNNIIASNAGPGLVLAGGNTSGNLISQNSFYSNGMASPALGIDLGDDGVTLNDNGDSDSGENGLANFPIITAAYISGPNLVIKGWSRPGATIEVFLTDINEGTAAMGDNQLGLSTDYGEGQTYLGTAVEGSVSDLDTGSSLYTDADGNTDNTNLYEFRIPLPSGVVLGEFITATATIANSTSEFSPYSIIKVKTIITNRRITYRVNGN